MNLHELEFQVSRANQGDCGALEEKGNRHVRWQRANDTIRCDTIRRGGKKNRREEGGREGKTE